MSIQSSKKLFSPLKVGDITLNHRIVMPPISRLRANWPNAIPSNMMLEHYSQRATEGGLIIAEATAVSAEARAYHTAPGLYTDEQVLGWKRITDVVHEKKGVIFVQLSHAGRATNALLTEGKLPITASVNQEFLQNKNIVVSTKLEDLEVLAVAAGQIQQTAQVDQQLKLLLQVQQAMDFLEEQDFIIAGLVVAAEAQEVLV